MSKRHPVFSIAPREPNWAGRVWIIAGAFACLLAGTGIVYFTGFRNNAPAKSDKQPTAAARMTPSETQTQPMTRVLSGEPSGHATSQPAVQVAASREPAAESPAAAKNPVSSKKAEPATHQPPARPENSSPAPVAAPAAVPADSLPAATKAGDDAAANSAARPRENMPPPQVVSTQLSAASSSAQLVPNVSPNLQGLGTRDKLSIPAAPLSKTVVPAEVITRVAPTYSELARRLVLPERSSSTSWSTRAGSRQGHADKWSGDSASGCNQRGSTVALQTRQCRRKQCFEYEQGYRRL